jgi:hypothetical protein
MQKIFGEGLKECKNVLAKALRNAKAFWPRPLGMQKRFGFKKT